MKPHGYRAPEVNARPETVYENRFQEFLPNQIEHCLRLTLERLQNGLDKRSDRPMTNPEVATLAAAVESLYAVYTHLQE